MKKLEDSFILESDNYNAALISWVSLDPEIRKSFMDVGRGTWIARTQIPVDSLESFVKKDEKVLIPQLFDYLL